MRPVEQYPRDEFDELADERSLRGSHRRKRHWFVTLAPILAAVIIAPLAGWGIVELMSQDGIANPFVTHEAEEETTEPEPSETVEPTPTETEPTEGATVEPTEDTAEETEDPGEPETTEAVETLPPVPGVVYDASIQLMDGTGAPNGTDPAESSLLIAGFTNIDGGDYAGGSPAVSAIYFSSPDLYTTAQNISRTLNIDFWAENSAMTGGSDILIIIR